MKKEMNIKGFTKVNNEELVKTNGGSLFPTITQVLYWREYYKLIMSIQHRNDF